jgi:hypothetical protein
MPPSYVERGAADVRGWLDDVQGVRATPEQKRLQPRNGSYARTSHTLRVVTDRQWAQIQKLGRAARWEKLSKQERSKIMRAVRAGHRKRSADGAS